MGEDGRSFNFGEKKFETCYHFENTNNVGRVSVLVQVRSALELIFNAELVKSIYVTQNINVKNGLFQIPVRVHDAE